jgi:hydroxylysine kinase
MRKIFTTLKTPVPGFPTAGVASLLAERYGLEGRLEPLSSERDQNFLVDAGARGRYVFKIANREEPPGVTDFQNRALAHIAGKAPGFPAPRVIETVEGDTMFDVTSATGDVHRARLLSWLEGTPLDEAKGVTSVAAQTGATLARLDGILSDFEHEDADYGLPWDIHNAEALADLLPFVDDPGIRGLCERRIERHAEHVAPKRAGLRRQVIYNDMNPSNVLVDPGDVDKVAGIIDFGDIVSSELVNDVAVAAAYLCRLGDDPFADVVEFLSAYTSVEPLTDAEIDLLPELIPARHLTTVMISHWRSAMYPENRTYILRSEERARRMLEIVANAAGDETHARFRAACNTGD